MEVSPKMPLSVENFPFDAAVFMEMLCSAFPASNSPAEEMSDDRIDELSTELTRVFNQLHLYCKGEFKASFCELVAKKVVRGFHVNELRLGEASAFVALNTVLARAGLRRAGDKVQQESIKKRTLPLLRPAETAEENEQMGNELAKLLATYWE